MTVVDIQYSVIYHDTTCLTCHGRRELWEQQTTPDGGVRSTGRLIPCHVCGGSGQRVDYALGTHQGEGQNRDPEQPDEQQGEE